MIPIAKPINAGYLVKLPTDGHWVGQDLRKLKPRQQMWAESYANHGVVLQACRDAGVSESSGYNYLNHPIVVAYLNYIAANRLTSTVGSDDEVISRMWALFKGDVKEQAISPTGGLVEKQISIRDQIKAGELLMKMRGMLDTNIKISHETILDVGFKEDDVILDAEWEEE